MIYSVLSFSLEVQTGTNDFSLAEKTAAADKSKNNNIIYYHLTA